jgi:hypothetical protein
MGIMGDGKKGILGSTPNLSSGCVMLFKGNELLGGLLGFDPAQHFPVIIYIRRAEIDNLLD